MLLIHATNKQAISAFAGCCLAVLLIPGAHAASIPDTAATGQALVAGVAGKYTAPPAVLPTSGMTDAPVIGNGDLALTVGGPAQALKFYVGKADFFGVLRGAVMPVGNLTLSAPALSGGSYAMSENIGPATLTGSFTNGASGLAMTSWVASGENTAVITLTNTGSQPLELSSQLLDGFADSAGNPATYGAAENSTWLRVSPDTVYVELGNQLHDVLGTAPFKGRIADFRLYNVALPGQALLSLDFPGAPTPLLRWSPANPGAATLTGDASVNTSDKYGGSAVLTGSGNGEVAVGDLPMPEMQFTFSAWINPASDGASGNIVSAQIPYALTYGPTFPYPFLRGLTLRLVHGALNASLNQSGTINNSGYMLFVPDADNKFSTTSSSSVPSNQWTQVSVTYDGNILKIYQDGAQVGATDSFPTGLTDGTMGWNKMVTHLGDTSVIYNDCAPRGMLMQTVLGAATSLTKQGNLAFTIPAGGEASIVLAAVTDRNAVNYPAAAKTQSQLATAASLAALKQAHDAWWSNFWSKSFVQVPDQKIQDTWYGSLYLLACCSNPKSPAPGLWGNFVSSTHTNWLGDYTLDYNYEAPFWGPMASNHMELVDNYDQALLDQMSRGRATGQHLLGIDGIYFYCHLIPAPGWDDDPGSFWGQKSNSIFAAVNCAMRWKFTRDAKYAAKVYPYLKGVADFWDKYLVMQNDRYVDLHDSVCENSGDDTNPATTIAFIHLVYPALLQMSEVLNVDFDRRAKWNDILEHLSPLSIVPSSSIGSLNALGAPYNAAGVNVIRDSSAGTEFPTPAVTLYKDHVTRNSSAGMNSTQAIFPGWQVGLESDPSLLEAARNTVWLAAEWFDFNNECTFYPAAAGAGFDPALILANLNALITFDRFNNFMINSGGGGTEQFTIVPSAIDAMFLQSYQANIHVFPDWPANQSGSFGNLNACGGFLVSSSIILGKPAYVQIRSVAGQMMRLANPWPGATVQCVSSIKGASTLSGAVLVSPTQPGEVLTFTTDQAAALSPPLGLTTRVAGNAVNLTWSPAQGAAGYNIKRATASGGPFTTVGAVTSGTQYTDSGLAYRTPYYYEVCSLLPGVESAGSPSVPATTGPPPPVLNNSFESPAVPDGGFENSSLPNWKWNPVGNSTYAIVNPGGPGGGEAWPTTSPAGVDGLNFCQIFAIGAGGGGTIYQDTGIKYKAGITYMLTAAFGLQPAQAGQSIAANSVFALYNSSLEPLASKNIEASALAEGAFTDQTITFTANGSEAAGNGTYGAPGDIIVGFSVPPSSASSYLDFDNVRLTGSPARP